MAKRKNKTSDQESEDVQQTHLLADRNKNLLDMKLRMCDRLVCLLKGIQQIRKKY